MYAINESSRRHARRWARMPVTAFAAVGLLAGFIFAAGPASASAPCPSLPSNFVCIPAQGGMEGDLKMTPGQTLYAGYNFANGAGATEMVVLSGQVSLDLSCTQGAADPSVVTVYFPDQAYAAPFPTKQSDPATYQGTATIPDACSGGLVHVGKPNAGPFWAAFYSDIPGRFQVQFHYGITNNTGHSWSASKAATSLPLSDLPDGGPSGNT